MEHCDRQLQSGAGGTPPTEMPTQHSRGVDIHGLEQGPGFLYSVIAACVVGALYALSFWVLERESFVKRCVDVLLPFTPFLLVVPMFLFDEPGVKMPEEVSGADSYPEHGKKSE